MGFCKFGVWKEYVVFWGVGEKLWVVRGGEGY